MSDRCQLTGAGPGDGHSVSHSHVGTSRRGEPDVQRHRHVVPGLGRTAGVAAECPCVKRVDRNGIEAAGARIRACGERI
ncbi:large ribosomal subunit protein bL28 [Nakamurella deserti]|uniref:large ribosomal subunit protein bL28 n=1 Tax=Nakamurella deserti TaxID=2164074 RepID=UPI000DBE79CD|nr:bL28 family ribosomal protein [Nakamurella deserti]